MTDVPGHTRGIVSLLANAGIRFLHIGVNPASTPPAVPPLFVWRAPDGSEVIAASTMDAFARKLLKLKTYLPIVTQELGDTWIHGAASDPKKLSRFRKLLALRRLWLERRSVDPESGESKKFSRALLLVLEHTWGLDFKTHLADYENYRSDLFNAARVQPNFQKMETSWQEQRDYVTQAVDGLGDSPLAKDSPML